MAEHAQTVVQQDVVLVGQCDGFSWRESCQSYAPFVRGHDWAARSATLYLDERTDCGSGEGRCGPTRDSYIGLLHQLRRDAATAAIARAAAFRGLNMSHASVRRDARRARLKIGARGDFSTLPVWNFGLVKLNLATWRAEGLTDRFNWWLDINEEYHLFPEDSITFGLGLAYLTLENRVRCWNDYIDRPARDGLGYITLADFAAQGISAEEGLDHYFASSSFLHYSGRRKPWNAPGSTPSIEPALAAPWRAVMESLKLPLSPLLPPPPPRIKALFVTEPRSGSEWFMDALDADPLVCATGERAFPTNSFAREALIPGHYPAVTFNNCATKKGCQWKFIAENLPVYHRNYSALCTANESIAAKAVLRGGPVCEGLHAHHGQRLCLWAKAWQLAHPGVDPVLGHNATQKLFDMYEAETFNDASLLSPCSCHGKPVMMLKFMRGWAEAVDLTNDTRAQEFYSGNFFNHARVSDNRVSYGASINFSSYRVIEFVRENVYEQCMSLVFAQATGVWHEKVGTLPEQPMKQIRVNTTWLIGCIRHITELRAKGTLARLLRPNSDAGTVLRLTYEQCEQDLEACLQVAKGFLMGWNETNVELDQRGHRDLLAADPEGTDCVDDWNFADSKGLGCFAWEEFDCSDDDAERCGYSSEEIARVRQLCPASCSRCDKRLTSHGDPIFNYDGAAIKFFLPLAHASQSSQGIRSELTQLLEWSSLHGERIELLGEAVGSQDTQWFDRFAIRANGNMVLDVSIAHASSPPEMQLKLDDEVVLKANVQHQQFRSQRSLAVSFEWGEMPPQNRADKPQVLIVAAGMKLRIRSALAKKFSAEADQRLHMHLNLQLLSVLPSTSRGLFAELAGLQPLSERSEQLVRHRYRHARKRPTTALLQVSATGSRCPSRWTPAPPSPPYVALTIDVSTAKQRQLQLRYWGYSPSDMVQLQSLNLSALGSALVATLPEFRIEDVQGYYLGTEPILAATTPLPANVTVRLTGGYRSLPFGCGYGSLPFECQPVEDESGVSMTEWNANLTSELGLPSHFESREPLGPFSPPEPPAPPSPSPRPAPSAAPDPYSGSGGIGGDGSSSPVSLLNNWELHESHSSRRASALIWSSTENGSSTIVQSNVISDSHPLSKVSNAQELALDIFRSGNMKYIPHTLYCFAWHEDSGGEELAGYLARLPTQFIVPGSSTVNGFDFEAFRQSKKQVEDRAHSVIAFARGYATDFFSTVERDSLSSRVKIGMTDLQSLLAQLKKPTLARADFTAWQQLRDSYGFVAPPHNLPRTLCVMSQLTHLPISRSVSGHTSHAVFVHNETVAATATRRSEESGLALGVLDQFARIAHQFDCLLATTGDANKGRQTYCALINRRALAAHDPENWHSLRCTDDAVKRVDALRIYLPQLPPSCGNTSAFSQANSPNGHLSRRLFQRARLANTLDDSDVVFLPLSDELFRARAPAGVSCGQCSIAVGSLLKEIAAKGTPTQLFTSLGVPIDAMGSAVNLQAGWCAELWSLPGMASLRSLSIEGFTYERSEDGSRCEARRPDGTSRRYRSFPPVTQDWSMSVPYPTAHLEAIAPALNAAYQVEDLVSYQEFQLSAPRPVLCGFLGSNRTAFRDSLMQWMGEYNGGYNGDEECTLLSVPNDYQSTRFCLMPAGTTLSRAGLYQAMLLGCVPVVFDRDHACAWWDLALQRHLPLSPPGFGIGAWRVLINLTLAESHPEHVGQTLAAITDEEYASLHARVILLIPRLVYFDQALPGVPDAADIIIDEISKPRDPNALLVPPVTIPLGDRLPMPLTSDNGAPTVQPRTAAAEAQAQAETNATAQSEAAIQQGPGEVRGANISLRLPGQAVWAHHISKTGMTSLCLELAHAGVWKGEKKQSCTGSKRGSHTQEVCLERIFRPGGFHLTMLREPRAWAVSAFSMCIGMSRNQFFKELEGKDFAEAAFQRWLENFQQPTRRTQFHCYNPSDFQTEALSCTSERNLQLHKRNPSTLSFQTAEANLRERLQFVGIAELYDESVCLLTYQLNGALSEQCGCNYFGVSAPQSQHSATNLWHVGEEHVTHREANVSGIRSTVGALPDNPQALQPKTLKLIDAITALDRRSYAAGVSLMLQRLCGLERARGVQLICPRRMRALYEKTPSLDMHEVFAAAGINAATYACAQPQELDATAPAAASEHDVAQSTDEEPVAPAAGEIGHTPDNKDEAEGHCKCRITRERLGPPPVVSQRTQHRAKTRYMFLLGYPYTGTTSVHALFGALEQVSVLGGKVQHGPQKEGWSHIGWKKKKMSDRWSVQDELFNWTKLAEEYHALWDLDKPILLENSPPEMNHAEALNRTFSPHGKVRFVVLVRSMCDTDGASNRECGDGSGEVQDNMDPAIDPDHLNCWTKRATKAVDIATHFGEDAIVIRYEDLCLNWDASLRSLEAWEPMLAGLGKKDTHTQQFNTANFHRHPDMEFSEFCTAVKLPQWDREGGLNLRNPVVPQGMSEAHGRATQFLGYGGVDVCEDAPRAAATHREADMTKAPHTLPGPPSLAIDSLRGWQIVMTFVPFQLHADGPQTCATPDLDWALKMPAYGKYFSEWGLEARMLARWNVQMQHQNRKDSEPIHKNERQIAVVGSLLFAHQFHCASGRVHSAGSNNPKMGLPLPVAKEVSDAYWARVRLLHGSADAVVVHYPRTAGQEVVRSQMRSLLSQPAEFRRRVIWASLEEQLDETLTRLLSETQANRSAPQFLALPYPTYGLESIPTAWEEERPVLVMMDAALKAKTVRAELRRDIIAAGGECAGPLCWLCSDPARSTAHYCGSSVSLNAGGTPQNFQKRVELASFALEPPGDTETRSHLYAAIASGTIPVLFDGTATRKLGTAKMVKYAWRRTLDSQGEAGMANLSLDYDAFAVSDAKMGSWLETIRASSSPSQLRARRAGLRQVLPWLLFSSGREEVGADAFSAFVLFVTNSAETRG
jgi:hypothetical protein